MCHKLYILLFFVSVQLSMVSIHAAAHEKQPELTEETIMMLLEGVLLPSVQEEIITDGSSKFQEAAKKLKPFCEAGVVVHEMPGRPCVRFETSNGDTFWVDYALARGNIAHKDGIYAQAKICTQSVPQGFSKDQKDSNWCE